MIKAVIFDCFGVLTVDTWRELYANAELEKKQKIDDLTKAHDSGFIQAEELAKQVSEILGMEESAVSYALEPKDNKNTQLLDYVRELRDRKYTIGLISNLNSNWIRETFLNDEEQKLFDTMTLSFEQGMAKPDPRIYKLTCEKLGVELKECVFIDDLEPYCIAAEGLGMKTIHYKNFVDMKEKLEEILKQS